MTMDATQGPAGVWELRIGVFCTTEQAEQLTEKIQLMLCPDPMHRPPCPIPWSSAHWQLDDQEAAENYPELIEQARIEQPPGGPVPAPGE
ncbi:MULTISPECIES: hypothetical protein [Pseudonocardia]|uniref:SPOR domain-containing protein n=2 Tax=Pseudonocardia TaxID=1847 RepID=A0A1Y2N5H0_PSEAH|nr:MULTISPECIES: hypothetical protein [Pseudonocardia]OSY42714.1 hypothetical protein BG845_00955 [Pseudonocardia autotrophica]TDN77291.1 hypothetical protein C8E95_6537 [Pseudonocardia autotrophica]BBG01312.1 hypothetical protein Pdca_25210 [Pseudonocardia autotrophica]GEC29691.1 hypothetical protein PSA01_67200 [Pseudonocardia saturnea]